MSKDNCTVLFRYEIWDNEGKTIKSYEKETQMPSAPTNELTFSDHDFTWKANRGIQYVLEDDYYFVRTVITTPTEPLSNFEKMFKEMGWE